MGRQDASRGFTGALDEISVYDRGLTAAEIARIHAAGSKRKCL